MQFIIYKILAYLFRLYYKRQEQIIISIHVGIKFLGSRT